MRGRPIGFSTSTWAQEWELTYGEVALNLIVVHVVGNVDQDLVGVGNHILLRSAVNLGGARDGGHSVGRGGEAGGGDADGRGLEDGGADGGRRESRETPERETSLLTEKSAGQEGGHDYAGLAAPRTRTRREGISTHSIDSGLRAIVQGAGLRTLYRLCGR